jgi:hypothetical protein
MVGLTLDFVDTIGFPALVPREAEARMYDLEAIYLAECAQLNITPRNMCWNTLRSRDPTPDWYERLTILLRRTAGFPPHAIFHTLAGLEVILNKARPPPESKRRHRHRNATSKRKTTGRSPWEVDPVKDVDPAWSAWEVAPVKDDDPARVGAVRERERFTRTSRSAVAVQGWMTDARSSSPDNISRAPERAAHHPPVHYGAVAATAVLNLPLQDHLNGNVFDAQGHVGGFHTLFALGRMPPS